MRTGVRFAMPLAVRFGVRIGVLLEENTQFFALFGFQIDLNALWGVFHGPTRKDVGLHGKIAPHPAWRPSWAFPLYLFRAFEWPLVRHEKGFGLSTTPYAVADCPLASRFAEFHYRKAGDSRHAAGGKADSPGWANPAASTRPLHGLAPWWSIIGCWVFLVRRDLYVF
jgi:hypothetical protein